MLFAVSIFLFAGSISEFYLLAPAAAIGISGLLLLALDNILVLLADIKQGIRDLSPEVQRRKEVSQKMNKYL